MKIIQENPDNKKKHLILFVHGLRGSKQSFQNPLDEEYFHEHFSAKVLKHFDIAFLEYHTEVESKNNVKWIWHKFRNKFYSNPIYNLSIEELSIAATNKIEHIHTKYESINYICHSMGGLIIKGMLINSKILLRKTDFYFTLATPHRGTNKAILIDGVHRQIKGLKQNSDLIKYLTHSYLTIKDRFDRVYYRATEDFWVTPKENAFPLSEEKHTLPVECGHDEISKPRRHYIYEHFIQDITKRIEDILSFKENASTEINEGNNEPINAKLTSIESKIDTLLKSHISGTMNFLTTQSTNLEKDKSKTLDTAFLDISAGYLIKDTLSYENHSYFILATKYDKSENLLIKYNIQNDIDKNFADDGKFKINFHSDNCNMNKILLHDEHLYIVGESVQKNNFEISICKITLDGKTDDTYGTDGYHLLSSKQEHQYANSSIILGKNIITVGSSFESKSMLITCTDIFGNLINEFGNNGVIETNFGEEHSWGNCICKYDENFFIVAGRTNSWEIFISKIDNKGQFSENFRYGGTVIHKHFLRVEALKVQSDGKILVAGVGNEGRIIRLHKDGKLDTTFGIDGVLEVITNERSEVLTLELFDDDSFLIGGMEYDGNSYVKAIIANYTKDGQLNTELFSDGFTSFEITNKTKLNNLVIHSKKYFAGICNYNIDFSQNRRTKIGIRYFHQKESK